MNNAAPLKRSTLCTPTPGPKNETNVPSVAATPPLTQGNPWQILVAAASALASAAGIAGRSGRAVTRTMGAVDQPKRPTIDFRRMLESGIVVPVLRQSTYRQAPYRP
jgi:hypothetical protein